MCIDFLLSVLKTVPGVVICFQSWFSYSHCIAAKQSHRSATQSQRQIKVGKDLRTSTLITEDGATTTCVRPKLKKKRKQLEKKRRECLMSLCITAFFWTNIHTQLVTDRYLTLKYGWCWCLNTGRTIKPHGCEKLNKVPKDRKTLSQYKGRAALQNWKKKKNLHWINIIVDKRWKIHLYNDLLSRAWKGRTSLVTNIWSAPFQSEQDSEDMIICRQLPSDCCPRSLTRSELYKVESSGPSEGLFDTICLHLYTNTATCACGF